MSLLKLSIQSFFAVAIVATVASSANAQYPATGYSNFAAFSGQQSSCANGQCNMPQPASNIIQSAPSFTSSVPNVASYPAAVSYPSYAPIQYNSYRAYSTPVIYPTYQSSSYAYPSFVPMNSYPMYVGSSSSCGGGY